MAVVTPRGSVGPPPTSAAIGQLPRRRLRIIHVNDIAAVGSALVRAMSALGHDAELVEPWRPRSGLRRPVKLAALPLRLVGLIAAAATVRRRKPDVVHVHYARLGIVGPLAGRPFALHVHGSDIRGVERSSPWGREVAPFLRRARLVYFTTPDLASWTLPFRRDATFLPNPIEVDRFRPRDGGVFDGPELRDLLVGLRLDATKGIDTIVDVLRLLAAKRPTTTITIVAHGGGLDRALAVAGPATRVVPLAHRADLPALIQGHRLALGQFQVGAMGNYELECVASGVPVVMRFDFGSAYPSPPPVVSVATADRAAEEIVRLLDDGAARQRLADEGPGWVAANHGAPLIASRVLADYVRSGLAD